MYTMRVILVSLLFVLVYVLSPTIANACSCGSRPDTLDEYKSSQVIVTGKIESVHKIREKERDGDYDEFASATLVVDKVYKGPVKPGDKLILQQASGADCAFSWSEKSIDTRWLFYLGSPSTEGYEWLSNQGINLERRPWYRTSFCGRSTTVASAAVDLAFLDALEKVKGKTRVYGTLSFSDQPDGSVEGIQVRISGANSKFRSKYLKEGYFEIYDLPAGDYIFEVMAPAGWKISLDRFFPDERSIDLLESPDLPKNQRRIRLVKGLHRELTFTLVPDTLIKGKVLSPTGAAMTDVCIAAIKPDDPDEKPSARVCSDAGGEFTFDSIDPGSYYLLVNPDGKIDDQRPFGSFYYPGVSDRSNAGLVSVVPIRYNLGLNIQIPAATRLVGIFGKFLFADDKPVTDTWVSFEPHNNKRFGRISARTDSSGRFHFKVPFDAGRHQWRGLPLEGILQELPEDTSRS
jgi:hypothetical protein